MSLSSKVSDQKKAEKAQEEITLEKSWIKDLKAKDENNVLAALDQIAKKGTILSADPIMELFLSNPSTEVDERLRTILTSLKTTEMLDVLIQWLSDDKSKEHQDFLISCIWESGFPAESHAELLVDFAIKGDYLVALEVLTVIENLEVTLPEGQVLNMIANIDDEVSKDENEVTPLLLSIKQVLVDLG